MESIIIVSYASTNRPLGNKIVGLDDETGWHQGHQGQAAFEIWNEVPH